MRVPIEGINDEALADDSTDLRDILSDLAGNSPDFDGEGYVFELNEITITNEHATETAIVEIQDEDEIATGATAAQLKLTIAVPPNSTVERSWKPGAGPRFIESITAYIDGGTGTVNAGAVHCAGALI